MDNLTVVAMSKADLKELFQETIREEYKSQHAAEIADRLYSPEEACKLFTPKISKVTLAKWSNDGLIPFKKLGGRIFYKYSDLIESGTRLSKYKRAV